MIQTVKVGSEVIVLDSEIKYTGKDNPSEEEKMVRKAVGLPVKKQLIYYTNKHDANSAVNVMQYQLIEMYDITERWYTVEITLDNGTSVKIHSGYLAEMQKPSFIADIAAQEA